MTARYQLRLMFAWGGGCLWCGNDAARERFAVGPIEDCLPLSPLTRRRMVELSGWHYQSLNWDYPPDPSPWSPEEYQRFETAAAELLARIEQELGSEFEVVYKPLGQDHPTMVSVRSRRTTATIRPAASSISASVARGPRLKRIAERVAVRAAGG